MTEERYNGWTNRETWAVKLWLDNDQGLYEMAHELVREAIAAEPPSWADGEEELADWRKFRAADAIKELYDALTDPGEGLMTPEQALSMVKDVGSDYRVNWDEIGKAYLDELD